MTNTRYADLICTDCATKVGATMPSSHIATYREDMCEVCGSWTIVTSASDFRFPKVKKIKFTPESKAKILEDLKKAKTKYNSQGNSRAVDEINLRITEIQEQS